MSFASTGDLPAPAEPALLALRERILQAADSGSALRIVGGGTKDFLGGPLRGELLDTRAYRGIAAYDPTELVVTARCGTPLSELRAALAERGQMLACEPPSFGEAATVGGMIAAGLSGPRRASAGAVRDFVLGAVLLDGAGELLNFGGQVMKNVAGYDVSRLLCGSMGILGVIAQVSLKVLPKPAAEQTVVMPVAPAEVIDVLNRFAGEPLPISATRWRDSELTVRFSGAQAAVEAAVSRFTQRHGGRLLEAQVAVKCWADLCEQREAFFADEPQGAPLWRLSLPSTAPMIDLPGQELIEWGGALRWWRTPADAAHVRQAAAQVGGSAMLFRGAADREAGVFATLSDPLMRIHERLKRQFDPKGLFNPARLYPGL
jgi:glycolate oxidase FAD binding subunit